MKRISLVLIILVAAVAGYILRDQIALTLFERGVAEALAADRIAKLPDGLHVGLCGAGSPMPSPDRAGPCTAVVAGRNLYIFDTGEGSVRNLSRMGLPPARVSAVFLTHFHSDHIDSLGALMLQRWAGGSARRPLPVYGPTGVADVVGGFNQAYRLDQGYRVAHHGPDIVPPGGFGGEAHPFAPTTRQQLVFQQDGLQVFAFSVDHRPVDPAVGYRLVYKNRSVVISGDTAKSTAVETAARGADLLVHEALAPNLTQLQHAAALKAGRNHLAQIFTDIERYHTTPEQVAHIAATDKVRFVLLTHIVPPLPLRILEGPFLGQARQIYRGPLKVGRDGDLVIMPAGSQSVRLIRTF